MTTVIIVKRRGYDYLRSLLRDGQPVVVDRAIDRHRAMEIVEDAENGAAQVEGAVDFGERPCDWSWQMDEEMVV